MSLQFLYTDLFDEETHRELDKAVTRSVKNRLPAAPTDLTSWSLVQLHALLQAIILKSKGNMDKKYIEPEEADELFNTHAKLQEMLVTSWNNKSFRAIRNLEILYPPSAISVPLKSHDLTDTDQAGLLAALAQPYQGVAVDALYEYLEYNNRNFSAGGYYARFCSIVQSSGTGKTRAILELACKGPLVLYINLRSIAEKNGFPCRDDVPASILTNGDTSEEEYSIRCYAFFAAVFKLIYDDISVRLTTDGGATVRSWNDDMCQLTSPYRAEFFKRLENTYKQVRKDILFKMGIEDTTEAMKALSINDGSNIPGRSYSGDGVGAEEMNTHFANMIGLLSKAFLGVDQNKPRLVIALDEAHVLHELNKFRRSTILLRAIKTYSGLSRFEKTAAWVIFASTTSKVVHFASPQALFDSDRVSSGGELLFPPFSEMGWDQHAPALGTVPSSEVARAEHIMRYGRPLWISLKGVFKLNRIFDLAVRKLSGKHPYTGEDPHRALSVLAQRFCLDICFGHREAVGYVQSSIASHLRVCITTTEDQIWSFTAYPSEPFLSCAAALSLHEQEGSLKNTLNALRKKLENGMIDIGQSGELVSRLLWLLAKDFFVIRNTPPNVMFAHGEEFSDELIHCQMIPVIQFLEFVFGDEFWSPDVAGPSAKAEFEDAYINFSHWVSMDSNIRQHSKKQLDQLGLDEWTSRHWQRTSGIQCCHNQPSIDKVIPMYFKSTDRMSQILISDKARADKDSSALHEIQRSHASIGGPDNSSDPPPYIAILADLGLEEVGLESVTFPTRTSTRLSSDTGCLRIHARGLSPETYPFLRDHGDVLDTLRYMVQKQRIPISERPLGQFLRDQVRYGSSAEVKYMNWEKWSCATPDSVLR